MSTGANCNISLYNTIKDADGETVKYEVSYWKESGKQGSFAYTPLKVLDPMSKKTALNPRFTQSIDAAILMRVAAKCADSKIWLRGVHDAYYSQINHFWKVHQFYKEAVVESIEEMDNITNQVFGVNVQKVVSIEIEQKVKNTILNSKYMTWF
jgi:DNA-directed RNA polymerase